MTDRPSDPPSGPATAITVRVPGSTSNLGPGYDVVGLALGIELCVEAEPLGALPSARASVFQRDGTAQDWPVGSDDLFLKALASLAPSAAAHGWRFRVRSDIPVARGLGSSAAAIVAGLVTGYALTNGPRLEAEQRAALLERALEWEGHPENVSASLLGGCTVSCAGTAGGSLTALHPVHASWAVAVAWPEQPLSTSEARAVLPERVEHRLAVENAGRLAFLLRGLADGRADWLAAGQCDHLHVPYRLALLPGAERALKAALAAGAQLATLSGSGSALVAIATHDRVQACAKAMAAALRASTGSAQWRTPEIAGPATVTAQR